MADKERVRRQEQKRLLRHFHGMTRQLLTRREQEELYRALRMYQAHRQVDLLISSLRGMLNTPAKLDLLINIRSFVPPKQVALYDQLAPYHQMAHPALPPSAAQSPAYPNSNHNNQAAPPRKPPRYLKAYNTSPNLTKYHSSPNLAKPHSSSHHPSPKPNGTVRKPYKPPDSKKFGTAANEPPNSGPLHSITLVKNGAEGLGFCIRGGSEHGLGIYVSEVEPDSPADTCGLKRGDCIIEVNNVSFENIASTSACVVFTGNNRLKMLVRRVGKIPGHKYAQEKTIWYDTLRQELVEGEFEDEEKDASNHPLGLSHVEGIIERRIHLHLKSESQFMGFNIRGGKEYDIGIYVSKIDPGGLAEQKGLKIGDQITSVNRKALRGLSHTNVVEQIRSSANQVVLTVRDVGRYPAYKEKYAEYSWVDVKTGEAIKTRSGHIVSVPVSHDTPISSRAPNFPSLASLPEPQNGTDQGESDKETGYGTRSERRHSYHAQENDDDTLFGFNLDDTDEGELDDDTIEESKSTNSPSMLVPHQNDIVLIERSVEEESPKKEKKGKGKKKNAPKSQLGVMALQREHDPDWASKVDQIQSLRVPGDVNPRDVSPAGSSKKSKSFREKLFGTKSRNKSKDSEEELDLPKRKVRKPLSNINFGKDKSRADSSKSDDEITRQSIVDSRDLIESESVRLLTADEATAVMRHLSKYEQGGSLQQLMIPLSALLDTEEKASIFVHIENHIRDPDMLVFTRETRSISRTLAAGKREQEEKEREMTIGEETSSSSNGHERLVQRRSTETSMTPEEQLALASHLRRTSRVHDSEMHPSNPGSMHQYEIHRPNSHSKVYSAKPEIKQEKRLRGTYSVSALEYDNHYAIVPSLRPVDARRDSRTSEGSLNDSPQRHAGHYGSTPSVNEQREFNEHALSNGDFHYGSSPNLLETGYSRSFEQDNDDDLYNGSEFQEKFEMITRHSSDTNLRRDLYSDANSNYSPHRTASNSPAKSSPSRKVDIHSSPKSDTSSAVYESVSSIYNHVAPRGPIKTSETVNPNKPVNSLRETRKLALMGNVNDHETQTSAFSSRATSLADLADLEERRSRSDDALASLDFLNDLDEGSSNNTTPVPPRSSSSPRQSPKRISVVQVHQSESFRNKPVFVAPPPPEDPPGSQSPFSSPRHLSLLKSPRSPRGASGRSSPHPKLFTQESDERWREWVRDEDDGPGPSRRSSPQPSLNIDVQADPTEIPRPPSACSTVSTGFSKELPIYEDIAYPASQTRSVSPSPTHSHNRSRHSSPGPSRIDNDMAEAQNMANDDLARNTPLNTRLQRFLAAQQSNNQDVANSKFSSEHNNSRRPSPRSAQNSDEEEEDDDERITTPRTIKQFVTVHLKKTKKSLGLSISGGVDSRSQPKIKIDHIFPGGAASDVSVLKKGLEVVSVDDISLKNVTHEFAVNIFRKTFANKANSTMQLVVGPL